MPKKAIVLGCGLIGETMARDLAADPDFEVTVADISEERLRKLASLSRVATLRADLSDPEQVRATVGPYDIVLGALPSTIGFKTLKTLVEAGKPYCDISFMPEDPLALDSAAKRTGATAVVDCGVSPGLSNLFVGYAHARLDRCDRATVYVGGLPKVRRWPYAYKAPFAPSDVIEEYTRPARMIENGKLTEKPALSEPELIDFHPVGTLEAVNTDGLRTLLASVDIPNMREKTLRYPGHFELMRVFRETGFFDKTPIDVNGVKVRPLDVTSALLFPKWAFQEGEADLTIMRVIVEGRKSDRQVRYTYELYDEYDCRTDTSSMARTTGFPCTIMARMIAHGEVAKPGVFPLEVLANASDVFARMTRQLAACGVNIEERIEELSWP